MRLERIIGIIMLLLQKEKTTAKQLAESFEVSTRTIYRDINSINLSGIPISSSPGLGGGIWIMPEYKLSKGIFSKEDLINILMGAGVISRAFSGRENTITTAKIRSLIPENLRDEIKLKSDFVSFDFTIRDGDDLKQQIDVFHTAMNLKNTVKFSYWSSKAEETEREIEPHKLVFQNGFWYLHGFCLEKQDFRTFKVSRMWDTQLTNDTFKPREAPPFFESFTELMNNSSKRIELIVDARILDRVLDYTSRDGITKLSEDSYKVSMRFTYSDYDYSMLLSFGDCCSVIHPKSVREELVRRHEQAVERNSNVHLIY